MKRILAPLIVLHRYLGLAFCLIFVLWFASGIVMIFKRMPEYTPQERLARLPPLTPSAIRLSPAQAFEAAGMSGNPDRLVVTTFNGRPVYRFVVGLGSLMVSAEDGSFIDAVTPETAVAIAGTLFPEHRTTARHAETLIAPDQWTIGNRFASTGALYRVSLEDAAATHLYIAEATGDVVMKTDRSSRFWGYAGPVMHWFYFTPLRAERAPLWNNLVVYGSIVGILLCVLGLVIGLYRFSAARRYFHGTSYSPYDGWLRWHHYAGLLFGVVTLTWTFSGLLTMTPWNLFPQGGPTRDQVVAIRGDGVDLSAYVVQPASALTELQKRFPVRELDFTSFMGTSFYAAYERTGPSGRPHQDASRYEQGESRPRRVFVSAGSGSSGTRDSFTREELLAAATAAMGGMTPTDVAWLTEYDSYYYDRTGNARLPVLRARFDDPDQTWLYLDANEGAIALAEVRGSRAERWLYQGLHSLDFPALYDIPALWYVVIVGLSLGGVALSATSVIIGWRFLTGTLRRTPSQEEASPVLRSRPASH